MTGVEPSLDVEADLRALCEAQQWTEAATLIVQRYGRELLSYLVAIARRPTALDRAARAAGGAGVLCGAALAGGLDGGGRLATSD